MLSRTRTRCAKVALGRTDALNGIDGARAGRPRYNSPHQSADSLHIRQAAEEARVDAALDG